MKVKQYQHQSERRQARVRSKLMGTADRPRLSVDRSSKNLSAQLIDDVAHKTLTGLSTTALKTKGTKTEKAKALGEALAKKAAELKIKAAIFDRGSYRYHGRIKALAESAREAGLKI